MFRIILLKYSLNIWKALLLSNILIAHIISFEYTELFYTAHIINIHNIPVISAYFLQYTEYYQDIQNIYVNNVPLKSNFTSVFEKYL